MIEPKQFYRSFDNLLANIGKRKSVENFLSSILTELENTFGETLHIANGCLYEEKGDEFEQVGSSASSRAVNLSAEAEAVQLVLTHGSYIYDNTDVGIDSLFNKENEQSLHVAFVVQSPKIRWIFIFDLKSGWSHEEITFCINIIRTALNYRLFSEAIGHGMEQSRQIQQALLPESVPQIQGYQIAARSQPAEVVGGDFYDFHILEDSQFGFNIGDASGHGLPAALLTRDVVTGLRLGLTTEMKIVPLLKKLNQVIQRNFYSARFVSLFYCEIEGEGHLTYVNAGHNPPILVYGDQVQELEATGVIMGALPEISLYRSHARLEPYSVLVSYTDGIIERENRDETAFGASKLKALVLENQDKTAQDILDLVFKTTFEFGKRAKWQDDATVVVIKRVDS